MMKRPKELRKKPGPEAHGNINVEGGLELGCKSVNRRSVKLNRELINELMGGGNWKKL